MAYSLFHQIISKCKSLEIFYFNSGLSTYIEEPISINHLAPKICRNLKHLKQLNLPGWHISEHSLRQLKKRKPSLKMVRVHKRMLVSVDVSESECQSFFNEFDIVLEYDFVQDYLEIEIFQ